ncbi:MAG: hypothetical protein R2798_07485 [Chitinophagales bacterium]
MRIYQNEKVANNFSIKRILTFSPWVFLFWIPAIVLLLWVRWQHIDHPWIFLLDTNTAADVPTYYGLVSNIGIICWSAAVAICFFSGMLYRKVYLQPQLAQSYFTAGTITFFLLMDDAFMFHEAVFPHLFGIDEKVIHFLYIVLVSYWLYKYFYILVQQSVLLLLLAFAFLGVSMLGDSLDLYNTFDGGYFIEDGLKFLGIVTWLAYFSMDAYQRIAQYASSNT